VTDIDVARSGELMVFQATGVTDPGVEFVDRYVPQRPPSDLTAVDAGRIICRSEDLDDFLARARGEGLEVTVEAARY
jgi:hypothetical protein